jgi:hypothetical protein
MDQLTLGLVGAGAVVVVGVMSYNAWQGAKVRRKIPRPMPPDVAQGASGRGGEAGDGGEGNDGRDDRPFIETARGAARPAAAMSPQARREPRFGGVAPPDTAADLQAPDGLVGEGGTMSAEKGGASGPGAVASSSAGRAPAGGGSRSPAPETDAGSLDEPSGADFRAAPGASAALAPAVDRRIDCIVPLDLAGIVPAEKVLPFVQRLRRAGTKPVFIEGRPEGQAAWEAVQAGQRYEALRAAVQLANRGGALNELEFSEFVTGVQNLADAVDGEPEFPDMLDTVAMARELDGFAAQCDAQLSVNILSDGAPWSANYVQAVASQDGLLLSRDGTRFVKLDAGQKPVFMLQFGDTNFLRDDLTYKGGHMITLLLDVPVADEDIMPFRLMCDYAASLSERIGAHVVDDQRRPLPESALLAIEKQLLTLYGKLEMASMPAGSATARRLFSN